MAGKPPGQDPAVQAKIEQANPDTADTAAKAADPQKRQSYMPIIFPLRTSKFIGGQLKTDIIAYFNIDTNSTTTAAASGGGFYERKASKRAGHVGATDTSAENESVKKTVFGKGTRGGAPRGKNITVPLGATTEKGTMRTASIRIPALMSSIEVANWIKTCFRTKTPGWFKMGATKYSVEALAPHLGQLPERKKVEATP